MAHKKKINQRLHAQRLKAIRGLVDFDYNLNEPLSDYAKRKIKKYFDVVNDLRARPHYIYRPRRADRLRSAQDYAQHNTKLTGLRVAIIPTADPNPRITFDANQRLVMRGRYVTTRAIPLDPIKLATNPKQHIREALSTVPQASRFTIQSGRHQIAQPRARSTVGRFIIKLMAKYNVEGANNHYSNWLHGLNAHTFSDQQRPIDYVRARDAARAAHRKKRRAAKRKRTTR